MSQSALVLVDLQNEYLAAGRLPLVGINAAVSRAARIVARARETGLPVIHVRHENAAGAPAFAAGSPNVDFIEAVRPLPGEAVVTKRFPNSFRETSLKRELEALGVTQLVLVGAMSHMCIDATARAAADLGYGVTLVHDACATRDLAFAGRTVAAGDVHAAFMAALAYAYARLVSAEEFLAA